MTFILIGMAGCGKSCLGRTVSKRLGMKNIDVDKVIEEKYGMKLCEIISKFGVDEFKKIEEDALMSIKDEENLIVSTGGSAIYYEKAMEHLKSIGTVIYVYTSLPVLLRRIGDFKSRGMVMKEGQTIESLYKERAFLYNKYADVKLDCNGNNFRLHQQILTDYITKKLSDNSHNK